MGVLVIAGGLAYYVFALNGSFFGWPSRPHSDSTTDLKPPTDEQIKNGQDVKKDTIDNGQSGEGKTNQQTTPTTPEQTLDISITSSNKTDQVFQVRTLINGIINDGTCSITLKQSSTTVTKSAKTQSLANSSTCQGFDIPLSELSKGPWAYTITVSDTENHEGSVNGTIDL